MKKILLPHTPIDDIAVASSLNIMGRKLVLTFSVKGALQNYTFPKKQTIKRANELWKTTCFELFLANSESEGYYELNVSPTMAWNFYYLKNYRAEVEEVVITTEPNIQIKEDKNSYSMEIILEGLDFERFDSCNLTAILLTQEGVRTFCSLQAMEGTPDFHNRDYFINL